MKINQEQLRSLIRRSLLAEQADAGEEFETAAREMDDDFEFDEEVEAEAGGSPPSIATNVRNYISQQFRAARDAATEEERVAADGVLAGMLPRYIRGMDRYSSEDQGVIRNWRRVLEDDADTYSQTVTALTAQAPGTQQAREQIYNVPGDTSWEYKVGVGPGADPDDPEPPMTWFTRKQGSEEWISLSAEKFTTARGNLDEHFPDARWENESIHAEPHQADGRQHARGEEESEDEAGEEASAEVSSQVLRGLETHDLSLEDAMGNWNRQVSMDDLEAAIENPTAAFVDAIDRVGTLKGQLFAALHIARGIDGIDTESEDYTFNKTPMEAMEDDLSFSDQKFGKWLAVSGGWDRDQLGSDGKVNIEVEEEAVNEGYKRIKVRASQLRALIRGELIREARRQRVLTEQEDAGEEFETAAREELEDPTAGLTQTSGTRRLSNDVKSKLIRVMGLAAGTVRPGTRGGAESVPSPEDRANADMALSRAVERLMNNRGTYHPDDQRWIDNIVRAVKDRKTNFPASFTVVQDVESGEGAPRQVARGEQVYDFGDNYEYTVKEEMWHTRKKGSQGGWISLAAAKYAPSRGNLDTKFPDAREADESGGGAPVRSGRGRQQARGSSSRAPATAEEFGLDDFGLSLEDAIEAWNINVSGEDITAAKADPSGAFLKGIQGIGGPGGFGTNEGLVYAALWIAGGFTDIRGSADDVPGGSEAGAQPILDDPEAALRGDMSSNELKLGLWLGDGNGWSSSTVGSDGKVTIAPAEEETAGSSGGARA